MTLRIVDITGVCRCKIFVSGFNNLHDLAMLIAVSGLSPVSIHMRIPAASRTSIVSSTPSCSRSSMPVTPMRVRSFSNWLFMLSILSWRTLFNEALFASDSLDFHDVYVSSPTTYSPSDLS